MRATCLALPFLLAACGDDAVRFIAPRWTHTAAVPVAPAGIGPERRVAVALREAAMGSVGDLVTLDEATGGTIEGPFPSTPLTDHAPLFAGSRIVVVTKIGKVAAVDLAGQPIFTVPSGAALGKTGPLALAPDGSIRVASTSGTLAAFAADDGHELFRASIDGAPDSPLAIASDGTTFAATDTGRVTGHDVGGTRVFDETVDAPASGPSVTSGGDVIVGESSGLRAFGRDGTEKWKRMRAARVVGTMVLSSGEILAWGEDGLVELLDAGGGLISSYRTRPAAEANPPPVYARPIPLANGEYGVVDNSGRAHLVGRDGAAVATLDLGAEPLREIAVGSLGLAYVAAGKDLKALDFAAQ